jgi:hypothetical protein
MLEIVEVKLPAKRASTKKSTEDADAEASSE